MLRNYITIAIRNLTKNAVYSFINVVGLAVGITCSLLIFLWVRDEVSFDQFHDNYDRLYQVYMNQEFSDGIGSQQALPYPLKDVLKEKSSNIKRVSIANWGEGNLLTVGENRLEKVGMSVGEDFLRMFSFTIIKGDVANPLKDPTGIVLTESTAKALFGEQDPLNQLVKIDNNREQKVVAIVKDVPRQSTLEFDYLLPFSFYEETQGWVRDSKDSWENNSFRIFVELNNNDALEATNQDIAGIIKENNKDASSAELFLHEASNWRLYSNFENGKVSGGMIEYVQMFSAIAIFILLIACINFMNLATARSEKRAREVGIRKSVGSGRKELILQFIGESVFITFIAFMLALVLTEIALPFYNSIVDKTLFIDYSNGRLWLIALAMILVTGIVAGSYPAFYLSGFNPVKVLKGKVQIGKGGSTPRKVLVVTQFAFSILLIISTVVIYKQIQFVKARDIGYNKENLMLVWTTSDIETSFNTIREELVRTGAVQAVCKSNSPITRIFSNNSVEWAGRPEGPPVSFTTIATEYDYVKTMGIQLLEGRDFSPEFKSDTAAVLINREAANRIGKENLVGEKLNFWGSERTIIGVMENVIMGSPYQPVDPLIMVFSPDWSSTITVRLEATNDLPGAIAKVESVFKKYNPAYPFSYRFADTEFDTKFANINLISRLGSSFSALAILITCLGLFGLAAFTAEQRTKEIGIRKVMGASVKSLVLLINKDFSRLVVVSFLIAAPLAWFFIDWFLERYPYRTNIPWWVLPLAGGVALILAISIVSIQALKAAFSNPSKSLRSE
ncbi:MAG: ABC transporter permease [Cytophagia bacterium]|nr:ABC transporter permease [Cytophagia bacterium]